MNSVRSALLMISAAGLAACGSVGDLQPPPGEALPVKPLLAQKTPSADDLLTPPPFARPERIDELMRRSMPREADRFDLPPPDGGAAPLPTSGEEQAEEDKTRVSTPQ